MTRRLLTPEQIEEVRSLREKGLTYRQIAKKYGITPEAVSWRLQSRGLRRWIRQKCELPECDVVFKTMNPRRRCCCLSHIKRLGMREERGIQAKRTVCSLPECDKIIWRVGNHRLSRKFCSAVHTGLNSRRWRNGTYLRILGRGKPCVVCGERIIVDEHHIEFSKNKSNKNSKTIWLCPTHHMAIHRGFAKIIEGKFVRMVEEIREGLLRKQKTAVRRGTAKNWEDAKH